MKISLKKKIKLFFANFSKYLQIAFLAAFGFIIAFTWKSSLQKIIKQIYDVLFYDKELVLRDVIFSLEKNGIIYNFTLSLFVTIICVIGIMILTLFKENKKNTKCY